MLSTFCSLFVCVRCSVRLRLLRWFQLLLSFSFKYFLDLVISLYSLDFLLLLLFCFVFSNYTYLLSKTKGKPYIVMLEKFTAHVSEVLRCGCDFIAILGIVENCEQIQLMRLQLRLRCCFQDSKNLARCGRNCNCDHGHGRRPFFKTLYASLKFVTTETIE